MYRYLIHLSVVAIVAGCIWALSGVPISANGKTTREADDEKHIKSILPRFEKLALNGLQRTKVPGMAIVIVWRNQLIYLKGFGIRRAGHAENVDPDTVFLLASVSKPITTTLLALLISAGLLDWDDPVNRHDPEFHMYDPWVTEHVTLRDLLSHRSGLPAHAGDLLEDLGYSRRQVLHRLRFVKSAGKFRARYAYTNFGFTEVGEAGARVAGTPWEKLIAEKLYRPLGMSSTSSRFADYFRAKNKASLHVLINGKMTAKYVRNADAQSPAGGVSSTARDLAAWMKLHLGKGRFGGKQLIKAEVLRETHRPQVIRGFNPDTGRPAFYGLGWNVVYDTHGHVFLNHSGAFSMGAATQVALYPDKQLGIAILTNAAPVGLPEALSQSFFDLVLEGKVTKDWIGVFQKRFATLTQNTTEQSHDYSRPPLRKTPPLGAAAYVGKYTNRYFGTMEVVQKDSTLALLLGPKRKRFRLTHYNRDVFTYLPDGEQAADLSGPSGVVFTIAGSGKARQVMLEHLDINGNGTFVRRK